MDWDVAFEDIDCFDNGHDTNNGCAWPACEQLDEEELFEDLGWDCAFKNDIEPCLECGESQQCWLYRHSKCGVTACEMCLRKQGFDRMPDPFKPSDEYAMALEGKKMQILNNMIAANVAVKQPITLADLSVFLCDDGDGIKDEPLEDAIYLTSDDIKYNIHISDTKISDTKIDTNILFIAEKLNGLVPDGWESFGNTGTAEEEPLEDEPLDDAQYIVATNTTVTDDTVDGHSESNKDDRDRDNYIFKETNLDYYFGLLFSLIFSVGSLLFQYETGGGVEYDSVEPVSLLRTIHGNGEPFSCIAQEQYINVFECEICEFDTVEPVSLIEAARVDGDPLAEVVSEPLGIIEEQYYFISKLSVARSRSAIVDAYFQVINNFCSINGRIAMGVAGAVPPVLEATHDGGEPPTVNGTAETVSFLNPVLLAGNIGIIKYCHCKSDIGENAVETAILLLLISKYLENIIIVLNHFYLICHLSAVQSHFSAVAAITKAHHAWCQIMGNNGLYIYNNENLENIFITYNKHIFHGIFLKKSDKFYWKQHQMEWSLDGMDIGGWNSYWRGNG